MTPHKEPPPPPAPHQGRTRMLTMERILEVFLTLLNRKRAGLSTSRESQLPRSGCHHLLTTV